MASRAAPRGCGITQLAFGAMALLPEPDFESSAPAIFLIFQCVMDDIRGLCKIFAD